VTVRSGRHLIADEISELLIIDFIEFSVALSESKNEGLLEGIVLKLFNADVLSELVNKVI
jgi:hypothetical protein